MINISQGIRQYSSEELLRYSRQGLVYCGDVDLSEFLEKLLEGVVDAATHEQEVDRLTEEAEESSDELENVREKVREALAILEAI